jgi:hypothetical protein
MRPDSAVRNTATVELDSKGLVGFAELVTPERFGHWSQVTSRRGWLKTSRCSQTSWALP